MIERKFIDEKIKEHQIQEYIAKNLKGAGHSHTKVQRTPLGERIIITASRPGLVVGRKGQNINQLTKALKKKFNLENPQIEINEVENINLDAMITAQRIADHLEKFGVSKFKGIGHKVMTGVMNAGALGVEITISGKIPSARAKSWRFYQGYLKKCGEPSLLGVKKAQSIAKLKTGVIGVKVSIMQPDVRLPDIITFKDETKEKKSDKGEEESANREENKGDNQKVKGEAKVDIDNNNAGKEKTKKKIKMGTEEEVKKE